MSAREGGPGGPAGARGPRPPPPPPPACGRLIPPRPPVRAHYPSSFLNMPLKIFNSLSQHKEEFQPLEPGHVKMYVCGPTVYDDPHIGHLRSAYAFEMMRRYLQYSGLKVTFVRNVTDIDDKIIDKARLSAGQAGASGGPDLYLAVREVTGTYFER